MINSAPKRLILPFSQEKNMEPLGVEVELASVFAIAEFERSKGKGLVTRQPNEKLQFMAQIAYPLWVYPKNETAYIFDTLNQNSSTVLQVPQLPSAKAFLETLESQSKTRQEYTTFLLDNQSYYEQPKKENQFLIKGLIADAEFKKEFGPYRREAVETTTPSLALLTPKLGQSEVLVTLSELEKQQTTFEEDANALPECLRQINKLTSQYVTELDYAAQAIKDEAAAKIKAQEEIINPQIAKLNSDYKKRITMVARGYDEEIESLKKEKDRTEKTISSNEEKIKFFQREAQSQARQNHFAFEKRWRIKGDKTKKEVDGLRKQLSKLGKNISNLNRQKNDELNRLSIKLDIEIKVARQPLVDLQTACDAKMLFFKQQIEHLFKLEKAVAEGVYDAIKEREVLNSRFEILGIKDSQLKYPVLFYVPFYLVCFQAGLSRRYFFVPPSQTTPVGFSVRLKGAFGMSKIKELFVPRFKAISALIDGCVLLIRQDTAFETEIDLLGEKNNFLNKPGDVDSISKGLVYLQHEGKLSEKEYQALSSILRNPK